MKLLNSKKSIYLLFVALYILYWGANYLFNARENQPALGFCGEKNRVLKHEEIIIAALESKYTYNAIKADDSIKTAQDFYKKYPFCCSVDSPAKPKNMRSFFTGKRYTEDPGYVVAELYFPTSDKVLSNPNRFICENLKAEDCLKYYNEDKALVYTRSRVPVSNCGGIGSSPTENLNIKDTPFGNQYLRASNLLYLERVHKFESD